MIGKIFVGTGALLVVAGAAFTLNPGILPGGDRTVATKVGTISRVIVATGRVEPVKEITLANKIPGRIQAVLVDEGHRVAMGQPLIRFDDEEHRAQLAVAEARVATATTEVERARRRVDAARARWMEVRSGARPQEIEAARAELDQARRKSENADLERRRFQRLVDKGHIARSQYDSAVTESGVAQARMRAAAEALSLLQAGPKPETIKAAWAQVEEARAALKLAATQVGQALAELSYARAALKTTVVESTLRGKVIRKLVEPGEAVDIGMPLMVLADVSKTLAKAEVDETDVGKLSLGLLAEITADAYPGRVFPGRVIEIGQSVGKRRIRPEDPTKIQDMKVLETKVEITQGGEDLRLGMTVDVRIVAAHKEGVLIIPKSLVPPGSREAIVDVVGASGPAPRKITLGLRDEANVEVTGGLRPGEKVLRPGGR